MKLNGMMWLGGMSGTGKTTISGKLKETYGIEVYHTDDYFTESQISETDQPYLWKIQKEGWESLLNGEAEHDANVLIQHSKEVCEIAIRKALQLGEGESNKRLVEGVSLFPEVLNKHGIRNAVFITQTLERYESSLRENEAFIKNVIEAAENPKVKYDNVVRTYEIILKQIEKEVATYDYPSYQITKDEDREGCLQFIKTQFNLV